MYNRNSVNYLMEKLKLKIKNIRLDYRKEEKKKYILYINEFPLKFEKTYSIYTFLKCINELLENNLLEVKKYDNK